MSSALVFLNLHTEVDAIFGNAIKAMEQDVAIIGIESCFRCDLRVTQDVERSTVESEPSRAVFQSLLHYMVPKHLQKYFVAIEVLRLDVRLPLG